MLFLGAAAQMRYQSKTLNCVNVSGDLNDVPTNLCGNNRVF
jgi:hypothetical protein